MLFWVGGYGADLSEMGGRSEGIGTLTAGAMDAAWASGSLSYGRLATRNPSPSPSWLAAHPSLDVVYAAHEGAGAIAAYERVGERRLRPLGRSLRVGESPCHIAVAQDGAYLVVSCYGDGRVVRVSLGAHGELGAALVVTPERIRDPHGPDAPPDERDEFTLVGLRDLRAMAAALGEDARADAEAAAERARDGAPTDAPVPASHRAGAPVPGPTAAPALAAGVEGAHAPGDAAPPRASHAHAAAFLPDGRIATTDLGFDAVRIWRAGPGTLVADHVVALPRGSGPRHMVVHPSGHLHVVTEYSCEVFTLAPRADGRWGVVAGVPVSPDVRIGVDFPSELSAGRRGEFLYAGVRGSDAIATLRVRGAGERVEAIGLEESGGQWPRHHLVAHDTLLVANQRSGEITSLPISERTGVPGRVRHRTEAGSPSCILPARTAGLSPA